MPFDIASIRQTTGVAPPFMIVYGTSGVGKTTFCSQAPKPIFIQTEAGEGLLTLSAFPIAKSFDDVLSAIETLIIEDNDFETLVIDSLDHLEPLIWQLVCTEQGVDSIEKIGYQKGYTFALDHWRKLVRAITTLRSKKNMAVVLIAHTHIRKHESPVSDTYDRYEIKLHHKAASYMQESADAVLFASHKIITKKEDKGFGQHRVRGMSTGERRLCCSEKPGFIAKNRYGLPDEIDLSWAAFQESFTQSIEG